MKLLVLSQRNLKEILRDKINLAFGIVFPVFMIALFMFMDKKIPASPFSTETLTAGVTVFCFSFISLFSGILIAKDKESSLFARLFTSPLKSTDFILSYYIPLVPFAIVQALFCYITAMIFGLNFSFYIIISIIFTIPTAILYVSIGLLCGSLLNDKQVGGLCGALLTNLSIFLSGTMFDINFLGKFFAVVAKSLPFYHAVQLSQKIILGSFDIWVNLLVVIIYTAILSLAAIFTFSRKIKSE